MRFSAEHGHAIIGGSKTTHWLPATIADPDLCPHQPGDLEPLTFPQQATDSYGQTILDRDGQPRRVYAHQARLRITKVTVSRVDDLDHPAARAAGFPDGFGAFADWWTETHCPAGLTEHQATRPCWVISFRVEYADSTRLLQRVHGYTGTVARAIDDLPAVDDRELKVAGELAERKRRKQDEINARQRASLDLQQRVIDARNMADQKGLTLRAEFADLNRALHRQDRRAFMQALEILELAVWPKAA